MFVGQVNDDAKRIFSSIAENSDFEIEVMERTKTTFISLSATFHACLLHK